LIWLTGSRTFHAAAWQHTFAAVFFGALLYWVLERQGTSTLKWLRGPMASFFAKTSYCSYLTHHWIAYGIFAALGVERTLRTFSGVATTIASFAATFCLCALSYRYFEKPLIELSHRRFRFSKSVDGTLGEEQLQAPSCENSSIHYGGRQDGGGLWR
jgi:peptidoglycan/LPS O-acetylase OafA/YrhL